MGAFATLLSIFFIGLIIYFVVKEPSKGGKGNSNYEHTLQYKEDTKNENTKINKDHYGADGRPLAGTPEFEAMIIDMAKKGWTKF